MSVWSEAKPFPGQDPFVVPFEGQLLLIQSTLSDHRISILRFPDLAQAVNLYFDGKLAEGTNILMKVGERSEKVKVHALAKPPTLSHTLWLLATLCRGPRKRILP